MTAPAPLLDGLWYLAAPSKDVKAGQMVRRILFSDPILLGRTKTGTPFALRDQCPHRAAPLSAGQLTSDDNALVECPYHGWRFNAFNGRCAQIPALSEQDPAGEKIQEAASSGSAIAVDAFHLHEAAGLLWIYYGSGKNEGPPETPPPAVPVDNDAPPRLITVVDATGPSDEAVLGLVDPAHTPVVHKQWWWRDGAPRREKTKTFEPTALGFRMPPHTPSSNSRIYKMLGGAPTTEIEFRLPGLRLEHIKNDRGALLGLTAMTPTEQNTTRITHVMYWTMPLLSLLTPVLKPMAASFLGQDGAILRLQNENLERGYHRPLYVGEPDTPAKWYFQLKRAWETRAETEGFKNPAPATVLRWKT